MTHAAAHPREGFWKAFGRLRLAGQPWNHKRVHRVYKKLGLSLRRKVEKRLRGRVNEALVVPTMNKDTWSIDFMHDRLENGRIVHCFNVLDGANREILHVDIDYSLKSKRVIWVLNHLIKRRTKPRKIRMDNGPEFIAQITKAWSEAQEIEFKYIDPGKPTQHAFYIERFNRSFHSGVLDAHVFERVEQMWEQANRWVEDYNHYRPHDSLKGLPPVVYGQKFLRGVTP